MAALKRNDDIIFPQVTMATNPWARARGLLGRSSMPSSETLWIYPCNNVHTFFMRFAIDVVFVDRRLVIKKIAHDLKPGKVIWFVWGAFSAFEFNAGLAQEKQLREGDQLHVDP